MHHLARALSPLAALRLVALGLLLVGVALLPGACNSSHADEARSPPSAQASSHTETLPDAESLWVSPEACERLLPKARASRKQGRARLMTYNVRWFPDGRPGKKARPKGTDIPWLACTIAASNVDLVLLQEIKAHPRALSELSRLTSELSRLAHGRWKVHLDDCPKTAVQHNAILYDAARVTASELRTYGSVNPHGEPCKDQLRPGVGGYFKFKGGLDLHVLNVHLKSGPERRSYDLRRKSVLGIVEALKHARTQNPDPDVVIGGDFNSMGCSKCAAPISAADERSTLKRELASLAKLAQARSTLSCSHYYRGESELLDLFFFDKSSKETRGAVATISGYCSEAACSPLGSDRPLARERLSDHCPVVLEVMDRDWD